MFGSPIPLPGMGASPLAQLPDKPMLAPTDIQPAKKGGMFGGHGKEFLLAALSGLMSNRHPQAAQMIQQALMMKYRQKQEDERYQHDRADKRDDFMFQKQWEMDHPAPVNNDTINDYHFIAQQLGEDAAKQWLKNMGDPTVTTTLPGNRVYSGPRSQLGAALGAQGPSIEPGHVEDGFRFKGGNPGDPNAWEQMGGAGSPAPRPFPY